MHADNDAESVSAASMTSGQTKMEGTEERGNAKLLAEIDEGERPVYRRKSREWAQQTNCYALAMPLDLDLALRSHYIRTAQPPCTHIVGRHACTRR